MTQRVVLEYLHPWTNSAGFFVASHQGWFTDGGLDVELSVADPSRGDSLAYLSRHEADFAVFPSNRLLVRRSRHQPLKAVASINHRAMETILTTRRTGITRPRELEGRRLALNPTPRGLAMVQHLIEADGGDFSRVELVNSGARELLADDVQAGEVDATFGNYWAWDALLGHLPVEERVVLPVDTIGAPPYHSYLLGTQTSTIERNPVLVRTLVGIVERGYRAARDEPALALEAFERYVPYFSRELLRTSLDLITPTWFHDGAWGHVRAELVKPYAEWLGSYGILPENFDWEASYTNEFLPVGVG
ncbi:ABC transporter substrate-binding protein [Kineosporia succinea]|uniref:Thiamine pyrimidine synthase n=1 Tax=Kineosporia succinea TaxID=84632 RepID=A0ABT9P8R1_9ACTN|nr:ABC transporter substrate-binding protein [Kineosporia succinea]MDP9829087.1 NitT/TauT family transport system substrate-binding protein [Kineosporia succinea]